jgi:hypothetical protein
VLNADGQPDFRIEDSEDYRAKGFSPGGSAFVYATSPTAQCLRVLPCSGTRMARSGHTQMARSSICMRSAQSLQRKLEDGHQRFLAGLLVPCEYLHQLFGRVAGGGLQVVQRRDQKGKLYARRHALRDQPGLLFGRTARYHSGGAGLGSTATGRIPRVAWIAEYSRLVLGPRQDASAIRFSTSDANQPDGASLSRSLSHVPWYPAQPWSRMNRSRPPPAPAPQPQRVSATTTLCRSAGRCRARVVRTGWPCPLGRSTRGRRLGRCRARIRSRVQPR